MISAKLSIYPKEAKQISQPQRRVSQYPETRALILRVSTLKDKGHGNQNVSLAPPRILLQCLL